MAPRAMASRASCTAAPFSPSVPAKSARSTPSKASGSATPTSNSSPARWIRRALRASTRSSFKGKSRLLSSATSLSPTSPAPTTATVSSFGTLTTLFFYNLVRDVEQVKDDAARGPLGPCPGPAYGEGNIRIAPRPEVEDVLGTVYRAEGALDRLVNQSDLYGPLFRDAGQVPEHVMLLHRQEPLHKFLQRYFFETLWNEGLVGDLLGFYLTAHGAREDYGLSCDIQSGEVITRVGLSIAHLYRFSHRLREGAPALHGAHNKAQSTARARLYLEDLVATLYKAL